LERKYSWMNKPRISLGFKDYNAIIHVWFGIPGVICKQTDFDGWVALVNKQQILSCIKFCYGEGRNDWLDNLIKFVSGLDDS